MIWKTKDGRKLILKNIPSAHLSNILRHIDKSIANNRSYRGIDNISEVRHNILQEIRFRKLNRLKISIGEEDLF